MDGFDQWLKAQSGQLAIVPRHFTSMPLCGCRRHAPNGMSDDSSTWILKKSNDGSYIHQGCQKQSARLQLAE